VGANPPDEPASGVSAENCACDQVAAWGRDARRLLAATLLRSREGSGKGWPAMPGPATMAIAMDLNARGIIGKREQAARAL
jgi:hypothetical protein